MDKSEIVFNKLSSLGSFWKSTMDLKKTIPNILESGKGAFNAKLVAKKVEGAVEPVFAAVTDKRQQVASALKNVRASRGGSGLYSASSQNFWKSRAGTAKAELTTLQRNAAIAKARVTRAKNKATYTSNAFKGNLKAVGEGLAIPGVATVGVLGTGSILKAPQNQEEYYG